MNQDTENSQPVQAEPRRSPQEQVEDAVFAFAQAVRTRPFQNLGELQGFSLGFLQEYPVIHQAVVAQQLVQRMMYGAAGFIQDAAEYMEATDEDPQGEHPDRDQEEEIDPDDGDDSMPEEPEGSYHHFFNDEGDK